jgi:type IV pilus assembly protein PilV
MDNKGFMLIEVLIGLILLAVGLLAVAGMQLSSVRGNFFSNYLTQASYAVQDRLEFLDNLPYDDARLNAGNHNDGQATIAGITFNRSYGVTINGNLKTIVYTVTWKDFGDRQIVFATIRSQ